MCVTLCLCDTTTAGGNLFNRVTLKSPFDIMASEAVATAGASRVKDILTFKPYCLILYLYHSIIKTILPNLESISPTFQSISPSVELYHQISKL